MGRSETILQFGAGRFLRAFADLFVQQAREAGQEVGRIVVAQSTPGDRARRINRQNGRFHVLVRGSLEGRAVERVEKVECVSRALRAWESWPELLELARTASLSHLLSNTTESGYELEPGDRPGDRPPSSFPARLLVLLWTRWEAGLPGLRMLPCELVENNGDRLRDLVLEQGHRWNCPRELLQWLGQACTWHNTLVDRIVASPRGAYPGLENDTLVTVADPFALWVIETCSGAPVFIEHPCVRYVQDAKPFALRKIRILNGAHTALVCRALPAGIETVREAVQTSPVRRWLERLLFEEIVPALEGRTEEPEWFARSALERFENPHIDHRLEDIALYQEHKVRIRLLTTRDEYVRRFGRRPELLDELVREHEENT